MFSPISTKEVGECTCLSSSQEPENVYPVLPSVVSHSHPAILKKGDNQNGRSALPLGSLGDVVQTVPDTHV